MNEQSLVRIVLWVTPEEKQLMSDAASQDDRPVTKWAIRTLRVALHLPPGPVVWVSEPEPTPAPSVASVVPIPAPAVVAPPQPVPATVLRPDGEPYALGFPQEYKGVVYHSSEEWQASPEFAAIK